MRRHVLTIGVSFGTMAASGVIRRFASAGAAREALLVGRGRLLVDPGALPDSVRATIQATFGADLGADEVVRRVVDDVRTRGDAAVRHYTAAFDRSELGELRVPDSAIEAAVERVGDTVMQALHAAAERIRTFHEHTRRHSWTEYTSSGGALGQIIRPLDRVAVYAPGGRAPYPSSVLMAAIPARVAGVNEVVLASPPSAATREVADVLLAAAAVAGVDAVYRVGGAQAIAALAYGTESVPRVDKIVGPGNLFVVLAKRMVFGQVGIEALPGPTECLVVADDSANPELGRGRSAGAGRARPAGVLAADHARPRAGRSRGSRRGRAGANIAAARDRRRVAGESRRHRRSGRPRGSDGSGERLCRRAPVPGGARAVDLAGSRAPRRRRVRRRAERGGDRRLHRRAEPHHARPAARRASRRRSTSTTFSRSSRCSRLGADDVREAGPAAVVLARAEGLEAHARAVECRLDALEGSPSLPSLMASERR